MVFDETLYREVVHKGLEACEGPVESESHRNYGEFSPFSEILSQTLLTCCSQLDPQNLMKACNPINRSLFCHYKNEPYYTDAIF